MPPTRALTDLRGVRTLIYSVPQAKPDIIYIGLNDRDPRWHDVHALDLSSGALSLVFRNDGFSQFLVDQALVLRGAVRARADGGDDDHRIENGAAASQPYDSVGMK